MKRVQQLLGIIWIASIFIVFGVYALYKLFD